jgi:lysine-specific histone demethylase 1
MIDAITISHIKSGSMMMATMDNAMTNHDDLNLMGMQELDSTLSIFESSHAGDAASTPGTSNYDFESTLNFNESLSQTIVVQTPVDQFPKLDHCGLSSQTPLAETR